MIIAFFSKIGNVACIFHRKFEDNIKTVTVSKTPNNKYFVSVLVETKDEPIEKVKIISENQAIGIDLGLKSFATLSNGIEVSNPSFSKQYKIRLAVKSRQLARKTKGSNLRNNAEIDLAKVHNKITSSRNDFHHKLSRAIVNNYDLICLEDLAVKNMVKNRKLSKAISDVSWSQFVSYLKYKADWLGKTVVKIGRFQASSQPCLACGKLNPLVKNLAIREWNCPTCNYLNYRDITASKNIKTFGWIQLGFKELEPSINKSILSGKPLVCELISHIKFELRSLEAQWSLAVK